VGTAGGFDARSGDWSPSTAQQSRWIINGNPEGLGWAQGRAAIGVEELDRFYAALKARGERGGRPLAGSTVVRSHTVVRLALAQAVVWGWRADNPAERANPVGTMSPKYAHRPPTTSTVCSTPPSRPTTTS